MKKIRSISLSLLILVVLLCGCVENVSLTATEIFYQSLHSVVELKSYSEAEGENFGTAVCVRADGTFVTNAHVVTYDQQGSSYPYDTYFVRFADEEEYRPIELICFDRQKDLALLRFSEKESKAKAIEINAEGSLDFGQTVYAIGNGSNYGLAITRGIVSIPKLSLTYRGLEREVVQCDLTVSNGNSGGALLDGKGRLIGLTTFRTRDEMGNVVYGMAYSLPVSEIETYLQNA